MYSEKPTAQILTTTPQRAQRCGTYAKEGDATIENISSHNQHLDLLHQWFLMRILSPQLMEK
jgi:hypothetical protein